MINNNSLESRILMGRTTYDRYFAKNLGTGETPFIVELLLETTETEEGVSTIINYATIGKEYLSNLTPISNDSDYNLGDEEIQMFSYLDLLPHIGDTHLLLGEGEDFMNLMFIKPKKTEGIGLYGDYHSLVFEDGGVVDEESEVNMPLVDLIFDDWLNIDFSSKSIVTGEFAIRRELKNLNVMESIKYYQKLRNMTFWKY